jgi:hypothetical protein
MAAGSWRNWTTGATSKRWTTGATSKRSLIVFNQ